MIYMHFFGSAWQGKRLSPATSNFSLAASNFRENSAGSCFIILSVNGIKSCTVGNFVSCVILCSVCIQIV